MTNSGPAEAAPTPAPRSPAQSPARGDGRTLQYECGCTHEHGVYICSVDGAREEQRADGDAVRRRIIYLPRIARCAIGISAINGPVSCSAVGERMEGRAAGTCCPPAAPTVGLVREA